MSRFLPLSCLFLLVVSCRDVPDTGNQADLLVFNARIWTGVDCPGVSSPAAADYCATALLIGQGGRVMAVGNDTSEWLAQITPATARLDAGGNFLMPGFIEGHAHFSGLGSSLRNLNFLRSKSWEDIVAMVAERAATTPEGDWISGRGWHQEKWDAPHDHSVGGYPVHDELSRLTSQHPVILRHASGHALFANEKAMEIAGVSRETPDPRGGRVLRDASGDPTGVFEERAMDLITDAYQNYIQTLTPESRKTEWLAGISAAQDECLRKGITSFQDAGSQFQEVDWYKELDQADSLRLRLWVMLRHSYQRMAGNMDGLPHYGDRFTCAAIKSELDGALGSYGAWLLEPYFDNPGFVGQNTTKVETVDSIAQLAYQHNMQLCVHAIGDRANRETLDVMSRYVQPGDDRRWRIEHAQHIDPADIPRFAQLGVIASMQGIHCTSDALFAENRLGTERARSGAYPWRSLLDAGATVTNGTDAPVEDVDPIESFYATVTRKRADGKADFFPEQAMTRTEALHSYTAAPAYAAFQEDELGTLAPMMEADFVLLSNNLLSCPEENILSTKVLSTYVGGRLAWKN
ncbi:amidohydrolase [Neolewinella lacunae]|uniref:Amidohydrolase n=1 Tax=Neolewinella lacunae TaxID=1517758 RepID=A0A923PLN5_9BACT|nr:amidohydrolase [Neolewinella lacunae]MBC6994715.1 amidohydrolase [Neolewinella lacunae]MDN3634587.1 amidohydrolase [Neolewinella lacunae]